MGKTNLKLAGAILFAVAACSPGFAQVDDSTGTLRGTVYDAKGAVIPHATVTAMNPATGVTRTTVTGPNGTYQIPQLNPATYRVQATAPGFEGERANEVTLTVGQIITLDGHLTVGSVDSVVEVNGNVTPLIDTEQTQQANTLNENLIQNLPNASRNFLQEVFTLPGVGSTAGAASQNQGFYFAGSGISVGASNGRGNLITVNSGEDDYGTGAVRFFVPLEAVQEAQVNRNGYQAEFGFASGAAINVITKSGTNHLHGSLFGVFDDHNTDSEGYLSQLARTTANGSLSPQPFSQNIYAGGSIGGHILRDKVFGFASYEFQKFDQSVSYPLSAQTQLQPFNGTINDTSCFAVSATNRILNPSQGCFFKLLAAAGAAAGDPADAALAAAFLNSPTYTQTPGTPNPFFPMNNPYLTNLVNNDNGTHGVPTRNHTAITRFDYQPNTNNTITTSLSFLHSQVNIGGLVPDGETNAARDYEGLANWVHIFNPNLFNKLLVQFAYNSYGIDTINDNGPEINIQHLSGPFGSLGHNFASTYQATEHRYELGDSLSFTKGHHNAKFGVSYRPAEYIVNNPNYSHGEFDFYDGFGLANPSPTTKLLPGAVGFTGFSPLLPYLAAGAGFCPPGVASCTPASILLSSTELFSMGVPYSFEGSSGSGQVSFYAHYAALYAQDSWKLNPRLTLTYGGRLDFDAEPSPLHTYKFFSPRVGLAWSPFGDQKTVVRAGGGAFVAPTNFLEPLFTTLYGPLTGPNPNLTTTSINISQPGGSYGAFVPIVNLFQSTIGATGINSPTASQETAAGLPPGAFGRLVQTADPHFTNQKVYQASVSVAQQLAPNLSLELGYIFYRGNHLPASSLVGYTPQTSGPIDPVLGPFYTESAAYSTSLPGGSPFNFNSNGSSTYHGGTASLTERLSHHVQFQANYTYSRSIDDTTDFNTAFASFRPNGLSLSQERGVSDFNRTNVLVLSGVYNTLGAVGRNKLVSSIISNVSIGPIFSASSGAPFDVDITSPFNNGTPGGLGNLQARPYHAQRNSGQGPGFVQTSLKVTKGFAVSPDNSKRIALSLDSTNLFNNADFSSVYNFFPSPAIGANGQYVPTVAGPNNTIVNLATGPFNLRGVRPTSASQATSPLYFNTQSPARQIQVGARFDF